MSLAFTELIADTVNEIPVLLVDASGVPVTGVVKGDVDPWYFKADESSPAQMDPTEFDWYEYDATNMAGWYLFVFNGTGVAAGILDTLGKFGLQLNEAAGAGTSFSSYPAALQVQPMSTIDFLRHILGLSQHNVKFTPATYDATTGFVLTGTLELYPDNNLGGSPFKTYDVAVSYDGQARLTEQQTAEQ